MMTYRYGIIAIHAGTENGTKEIAEKLANGNFDLFENISSIHITSTKFEDPLLDKLLSECEVIISIHGEHDRKNSFVVVGGLYTELADALKTSFTKNGFTVREKESGLMGRSQENVCNRGLSGKGVQLELSYALRMELLNDEKKMDCFVQSIRDCL